MRLLSFKASSVHDYLNFDITFRPDVNFIAGLNGAGKTTALNLIMALISPDVDILKSISFKSAEIVVERDESKTKVLCNKGGGHFKVSVFTNNSLVGEFSDESIPSDIEKYFFSKGKRVKKRNVAISELSNLPSPMFLSLDRRFIKSSRRNAWFTVWQESDAKKNNDEDSLDEAISIISKFSAIARSQQSGIDKSLRDDIVKTSLNFNAKPEATQFPSRAEINGLIAKHQTIQQVLESLDIPSDEFSDVYESFFRRMIVVANKIEEDGEGSDLGQEINEFMFEWFLNLSHLKRIDKIFSMVQKYQNRKTAIYSDISRFEAIVNNFLKETGKKVIIGSDNIPKVKINGSQKELSVLSSGETQILIMFTHLVLNKKLPKNGIFIIDEPELSLHISWQDMFVEAVQAANPSLQIILATHSPAIIGGRNDMYVPLNGGA